MSKKVLMIVGSLRKGGFNKTAADYVATKLQEENVEVNFLDFTNVPFMNQDIEFPTPKEVAEVRNQVVEADGLWFVTPEYNGFLPGVLKNLLDWLSRPLDMSLYGQPTIMANKAVTISGVAGRSGAAGARGQLETLLSFSSNVIAGAGTGLVLPAEAFGTGVFELSADQKAELDKQVAEFVANI